MIRTNPWGVVASLVVAARAEYLLESTWGGKNDDFFSHYNYYTAADQTHGFVNFQGPNSGLTYMQDGVAYIRTDYQNRADNAGRKAIKLYSKENWTRGLFIIDFAHIPGSICGSWPAWWFNGEGSRTWPATGEIDVLEYVHRDTYNLGSLHTSPGCYLTSKTGVDMSGHAESTDCGAGGGYQGCGSKSSDARSAGDGFNNAGGGLYVLEINFEQSWPIKMWSFVRSEIPADITQGQPNPLSWKMPFAEFKIGSSCPANFFEPQTMIFDQTFCGDWAGNVWSQSGCAAATGYGNCNDYVRDRPQDFENAYFAVNDLKIYQWNGGTPPSPVPSPTETPGGKCTPRESDPYASGSFVPCCGGDQKCLRQSAGWAYRCQPCSQSCPDDRDFNGRCNRIDEQKAKLFQGRRTRSFHLPRRPHILRTKDGFSIVTNGSCASHGLRRVTNMIECVSAANSLSLAETQTDVQMFSTNDAPTGCVHENGSGGYKEGVIYNPFEDTVECGIYGYYDCICADDGLEAPF